MSMETLAAQHGENTLSSEHLASVIESGETETGPAETQPAKG